VSEQRSDRDLVAAHLAGDRDAFAVLFGRHRHRLSAEALSTTCNPDDAADALQDAMVSAFRRAASYRGDAAVTTWLHRIVVNACLDRLRRSKVRAADQLPDDLDEREAHAPATADAAAARPVDPEQVVLDDEQRRTVLAALARLPVEQRAALVLVDMEGYSVEEAAQILDCAVGTVKSRCSRGRTRLLPALEGLRPRPPRNPDRPPSVQTPDHTEPEGGGER
jgi:RNA polymerase sigma-70 factor (ECF subfamily)